VLQEAPYASNWLRSKIEVLKGGTVEKSLDIQTLRKDIMSVVATGALAGVPMPLSSGVLSSLSAAVANGRGGGDLAELPGFVRARMLQDFR
jgi:3-hydroxyisobutyrate dehydrogenase-like beta-hydroxyacid dehydrogenase